MALPYDSSVSLLVMYMNVFKSSYHINTFNLTLPYSNYPQYRTAHMELQISSFIGSMNEEISIEKEGKDLMIGFNPKFFMDALRVIDEEDVMLYMVNPKAPCFIRDDNDNYIYLILPVNFNSVNS